MNRESVTGRPANHFEKRSGRGESCEGCASEYTRLVAGDYRCPACEAYMASHHALAQSYAVLVEKWRDRFGLSREGALTVAREFDGLFDDVRDFLMDGYTMAEYHEQRELKGQDDPKAEAVTPSYVWELAA